MRDPSSVFTPFNAMIVSVSLAFALVILWTARSSWWQLERTLDREKSIRDEQRLQTTRSAPLLVLERSVQDFGAVRQESTSRCRFPIFNRGQAVLKLWDIKCSCGCATVLARDTEIQPGAASELIVEYRSSIALGSPEIRISFQSNDPHAATTELIVKAQVVPYLDARPSFLNFGEVLDRTRKKVQVELKSRCGRPFVFVSARSTQTEVTVLPSFDAVPKTSHTLSVELQASFPRRTVLGQVLLDTDLPDNQTVKLPFIFHVRGKINVRPNTMALVKSSNRQPSHYKIALESESDLSFRVLKLKVTEPVFIARLETLLPGSKYEIHLDLQESEENTLHEGELIIYTDFAEEAEIRIPLSGRILTPPRQVRPPVEQD